MRPILAILFVFFLACSSLPDISGKTIRLAISADPKGFDPAFSTDVVTGKMNTLLFDTMIKYDKKTNLEPNLATHWEISEDGKRYTFHLRDDVMVTHGRKLVSMDVKKSIERIIDPQINSPLVWVFERINEIAHLIAIPL